MPRITPPFEEKVRRTIRDTMAIDPIITQERLREAVERKVNHQFSPQYIRKLSNKVAREVRLEADHTAIEERLAGVRESFRLGRERLMRIIYWTPEEKNIKQPFAEEIVKAVSALVTLDLAILDAELNAGLYKKNEETILEELQYRPLAPELRDQIVLTYRRWGRLPEEAVEKLVPHEAVSEHAGPAA